jgi:hypothetical protein
MLWLSKDSLTTRWSTHQFRFVYRRYQLYIFAGDQLASLRLSLLPCRHGRCRWPMSVVWQTNWSAISWLSGNISTGAAWRWASSFGARCCSTVELQCTVRKPFGSDWARHRQEGGSDVEDRLRGLLCRWILAAMEYFLWEHRKEHVYAVSLGLSKILW